MSPAELKERQGNQEDGARSHLRSRAPRGAGWDERCAVLFEDLRKPARVMVSRAYGSAIRAEEFEDIYASAWTSTLAALRGREGRLDDEELRSYLLTAVANHASKEMRRRSRKPTNPLDDLHAAVIADDHSPAPDERAVGSEDGSVARDVLTSLPRRRRAVMLLRYGWGLGPKEICAMVEGLSPRAYRKEITKGVEQMIEGLRQVESGEWCESRMALLRDHVAGVAGEDEQRQAVKHLEHCRDCREFVGRLTGRLHELGSFASIAAVAEAGGGGTSNIADWFATQTDRGRELFSRSESAADSLASVAAGGGARGAGAAGGAALAKLAALGAAGKTAVACLAAGATVTACVATGVLPSPGDDGREGERTGSQAVSGAPGRAYSPAAIGIEATDQVYAAAADAAALERRREARLERQRQRQRERERRQERAEAELAAASPGEVAPTGAPTASPAPSAPAVDQEFGLPGAAASGSGGGGGGGGDPSAASKQEVTREFGP